MVFRISILLLLSSLFANAQHKGFSYELQNEVGTFELVSLTVTYKTDNTEGVTYVIHKQSSDTVYRLNEYLNGWVGLSRDGRTIAHLVSETKGVALEQSQFRLYRDGKLFKEANLDKLIHYDLQEARLKNQLSKNGWLKNDSALHKMATSSFYVSDDKLFISFSEPKLTVFDLNQMFRIYTGNGANHFTLNYYSIPNAPFRTNYDWEEYLPNGFPKTLQGDSIEQVISTLTGKTACTAENALLQATVEIKLLADGNFELRKAVVSNTGSNEKEETLSKLLAEQMKNLQFSTTLLPPQHPAWVFEANVWLK
ncbi:MAG: hypothetical protein ACPGD8_03680 [Flavobacteriales bacterium]